MEISEVVAYLTEKLDGYSAMDGIGLEEPFGLGFTEEKGLKKKDQADKRPQKTKPYDAAADMRLGGLLKQAGKDPKKCIGDMCSVALLITSAVCGHEQLQTDHDEIKKLLEISGWTAKDMEDYAVRGMAKAYTSSYTGCFGMPENHPEAMLLHRAIWDALNEQCGILPWQQDKKHGSKEHGKKHNGRQVADRWKMTRRLQEMAGYLEGIGILNWTSLRAGMENGESASRAEVAAEAARIYKQFYLSTLLYTAKYRIGAQELRKTMGRARDSLTRVNGEFHRLWGQECRKVHRPKALPQDMQVPQPQDVFGLPGRPLGSRIGLDAEAEFSWLFKDAQLDLAEKHGKAGDHEAETVLIRNVLERYPLPQPMDRLYRRKTEIWDAINGYAQKAAGCVCLAQNKAKEEEWEAVGGMSAKAIAEAVFLAVLDGNDKSLRLNALWDITGDLAMMLGVSGKYVGDDDPYEEDEEKAQASQANNLLRVAAPEWEGTYSIDCKDKAHTMMEQNIRLCGAVAQYSKCRFSGDLYIRKDVLKAFRSMGCSERKARDYAVITAALGYARKYGAASYGEGIFSPWMGKDPDTGTDAADAADAEQEAAGVLEDELEAMQEGLEEAQRARKSAAQECQALRHELAALKKKQEETEGLVASLQGQVADRDLLISAYEEGAEHAEDADAEDGAADAVGFPFRTGMKAVLYGGFPQFHREIGKLFPDIRIVPPAAHLDMSVFQTADVIFIQINRTNHSNYWNVVSTAKTFGVPYYHLNYANPKRCAQEMVKKIRKETEERI